MRYKLLTFDCIFVLTCRALENCFAFLKRSGWAPTNHASGGDHVMQQAHLGTPSRPHLYDSTDHCCRAVYDIIRTHEYAMRCAAVERFSGSLVKC